MASQNGHRQYTADDRARALTLYEQHGPSKAADLTGVRAATIRKWAQRSGVTAARAKKTDAAIAAAQAKSDKMRAELKPKLLAKVHDLLQRMDEPHQEFVGQQGKEVTYDRAPAAAVKAYATSVGILIDKFRLESGEATERSEHVTQSQFDREVADLVDKVRQTA